MIFRYSFLIILVGNPARKKGRQESQPTKVPELSTTKIPVTTTPKAVIAYGIITEENIDPACLRSLCGK